MTVVMLTRNGGARVLRSLERVVALPERPAVIAVDNGSTDRSAEQIARRFPAVDVVHLPENRGAAGRNAGVERARTPYVAFSDDDTCWAPGALGRAADLFDAHPRLGLVTARILLGAEGRLDPGCAAMARSPLSAWPGLPGRPVLGFSAGATVMRRFAFEAAGGFEPRLFVGGEEQLLAVDMLAAGWAAAYVAEVEAHRESSGPYEDERRQELSLRNALWFAWMRRPAGVAIAASARALMAAWSSRCQRRAIVQALRGLPWALRRRRVVPVYIENGFRRLAAERRPTSVRPNSGSVPAV